MMRIASFSLSSSLHHFQLNMLFRLYFDSVVMVGCVASVGFIHPLPPQLNVKPVAWAQDARQCVKPKWQTLSSTCVCKPV